MQMKIVLKFILASAAVLVASGQSANAQSPPTSPASSPADSPPGTSVAAPAPGGEPADRAAPDTGGPVLELPAERDMPQMALPRESAIENPLRQHISTSATAIGGYG